MLETFRLMRMRIIQTCHKLVFNNLFPRKIAKVKENNEAEEYHEIPAFGNGRPVFLQKTIIKAEQNI